MPSSNINDLGIDSLADFDRVLQNALVAKDSIKTSWLGSRESFTLELGEKTVAVKMEDIVKKFQELAINDHPDNKVFLIGDVHDNIIALDLKGDIELSKRGPGAIFFRNVKNIFSDPHIKKIDGIAADYLFQPNVKEYAQKLSNQISKIDKLVATNKQKIADDYKQLAEELIKKANDEDTRFKTFHDTPYETHNALRYLAQKKPEALQKIIRHLESFLEKPTLGFEQTFKDFIGSLKREMWARYSRESAITAIQYKPQIEEIKRIYNERNKSKDNFYEQLLQSDEIVDNFKLLFSNLAKSNPGQAIPIIEAVKEATTQQPQGRTKIINPEYADMNAFCEDLLKQIDKALKK